MKHNETRDGLDEFMHPVGTQGAWSESYYFNFVDPSTGIGMFTRMGFRPGDGWADALHAVYLPGSRVAFTYGRREIKADLSQYDGDLRAGNLAISLVEPHKRWQIHYDGPAQDIADAAVLLQRSKLRPEGWFVPAELTMKLAFECTTEPHFTHSEEAAAGAFGHFEQSGRVSGRIEIAGERFDVDGYGVRDKSWGPRDWGAGQRNKDADGAAGASFSTADKPAPFVNWFSMNFGPDIALGGSCFRQTQSQSQRTDESEIRGAGWIQRAGATLPLNDIVITSEYRDDSILHKAVRLAGVIDGTERIEITGQALNMCPTKVPMPGGATFINEGLFAFDWAGKKGFGIAEHWHAVKKG